MRISDWSSDVCSSDLAMADVFVFPTLGDPYGLVVDEALACSLPVISTSEAGEINCRVESGVNGYIVPAQNSSILANRKLNLARDKELRKRMGSSEKRRVGEECVSTGDIQW